VWPKQGESQELRLGLAWQLEVAPRRRVLDAPEDSLQHGQPRPAEHVSKYPGADESLEQVAVAAPEADGAEGQGHKHQDALRESREDAVLCEEGPQHDAPSLIPDPLLVVDGEARLAIGILGSRKRLGAYLGGMPWPAQLQPDVVVNQQNVQVGADGQGLLGAHDVGAAGGPATPQNRNVGTLRKLHGPSVPHARGIQTRDDGAPQALVVCREAPGLLRREHDL